MSRGHSIYHYGTKADYESVIADVAKQLEVKYTVDEWRLEPDFRVYRSPLDAPDFGVGFAPQDAGTNAFFVLTIDAELPFSHRPQRKVPEKYGFVPTSIPYPLNHLWIQFRPSGFHKSEQFGEGLLQGWLATNSGHPDAIAIFNAFKKSIKKRFEYFRHSGVYVGPAAVKYFEAGGRLTEDLRRPREWDAKREPSVPSVAAVKSKNNKPKTRISYEDSCRRLQPDYLEAGVIPPIPERMPQFDDPDPLGVSFFRTSIGEGDDLSNLTLPRTFFGKSEINDASFQNADLTESNLCWNDFVDVDFTDAILARSDLRASLFNRVKFVRTDLRGTDMRQSSFEDCDFENALMTGAILAAEQGTELNLSEEQRGQISWADEGGPEPSGG